MTGMMNNLLLDTAVILSGHEKIVTRAYNEESMLMPNDLALLETDELIDKLEKEYPNFFWTPRITFAGLLDVPDEKGETKSQGPVIGMGIDFFTNESRQVEIWGLERNLVNGTLPVQKNDVLISSKLADKLNVYVGEQVTFIGSTICLLYTSPSPRDS